MPVNLRTALKFMDKAKARFIDNPEGYDNFIDIMKKFRLSEYGLRSSLPWYRLTPSYRLDTPSVMEQIAHLFCYYPELITGFNAFLPQNYTMMSLGRGEVVAITPEGIQYYHSPYAKL